MAHYENELKPNINKYLCTLLILLEEVFNNKN